MNRTLRLIVLVGAAACGPSYQALYEADARFEHCYALDESGVQLQQKSQCWRDWTLRYTYGQTRDRVEYAAARYRALTRAPEAPTDEAMMEAAPGEGRALNIVAPAPTSAFAPPPKTLDVVDGGARPGNTLPGYSDAAAPVTPLSAGDGGVARPPGADCGEACTATWNACKEGCIGKRCEQCAAAYKKCMARCFPK